MASENKKVEKKKQDAPQKGKAYVDTSNSKIVKGSDKFDISQDKAVIESVRMATNLEEFLRDLAGYRDRLHDFSIDGADRSKATLALYEMITGKTVEPIYDEDGEEDELLMDWDEFRKYWDEIEETAKSITPEKMKEVIEEFKYDLDEDYYGESLKQSLLNALNEALSNRTMKASDVNNWLKKNNLSNVINNIKSKREDGRYNINDILSEITTKQGRELESEVISNIKIDESSATDEEIDMEEENSDSKEEKDSCNTPEPKEVSEKLTESVEDEYSHELVGAHVITDLGTGIIIRYAGNDRFELAIDDSDDEELISKSDIKKVTSYRLPNEDESSTDDIEFDEDDTMNEHKKMKRLIHLMALKESANSLVSKFGITDIKQIKESLIEELTDKEYEIVLEDVYTTLNITVDNDYKSDTESITESLRSNLHNKLI